MGERFKSVVVEKGETLVNCLAYIDLNPVRAGLVKRPEDYRWSSLGYHAQTGNADEFLSMDFGLIEFGTKYPFQNPPPYEKIVDNPTIGVEKKGDFRGVFVHKLK